MATKKDLQQAQAYSRQRVLTAFTSGIPGGKELEPSNPMRTVTAAIALALILALGSLVFGLVKPGLPNGWDNNKLLVSTDTGARYVSKDKQLYPVLNTTSARLVIPAGDFDIISVTDSDIAETPRRNTIGIFGAPDQLPTSETLVQRGWASCIVGGEPVTILDKSRTTTAVPGAIVASLDSVNYLVTGSQVFEIGTKSNDVLLRQLGLEGLTPIPVTARWLNLFDNGTKLVPFRLQGAGATVTAGQETLTVGTAVHPTGTPVDNRYLVTSDGKLALLSPFAYQLYLLGNGPEAVDIPASVSSGSEDKDIIPADWPSALPEAIDLSGSGACATLDNTGDAPVTTLSTTRNGKPLAASSPPVVVAPTGGAIVRAIGGGDPNNGQYTLIDGSGTAFPVPDATKDILAQLGYSAAQVTDVPMAWVGLFATGPDLTPEAARRSPAAVPQGTEQTGQGAASGGGASSDAAMGPVVSRTTSDADTPKSCEDGKEQFTVEVPTALATLQAERTAVRATGSGILVAVVDSGVDASNAHLASIIVPGKNFVDDGTASDGTTDRSGHGTAIAGIIAAQRVRKSGVVGLAPGAKILPVRVFATDSDQDKELGRGPDSARVAAGIRYAVGRGAQIINVSLSDVADRPDLRSAVAFAASHGSLVVASGGNRQTTTDTTDSVRYPAGYPGALGVTATGENNLVDDASIHGPQVDVSAPGLSVLTADALGGDCVFATSSASSSFATAYVSAAAALVADALPSIGPAGWKYRLEATASRAGADRRDDTNGWGLIQPYEAVTAILDSTSPGPVNPVTGPPKPVVVPDNPVPLGRDASPLAATRSAALWIAVIGGTILALLGLLGLLSRLRSPLA